MPPGSTLTAAFLLHSRGSEVISEPGCSLIANSTTRSTDRVGG